MVEDVASAYRQFGRILACSGHALTARRVRARMAKRVRVMPRGAKG
jgi:hypothetical protein